MKLFLIAGFVITGIILAQCPDFSAPGPYDWTYRTVSIPSEDETMSGSRIYYPVVNDTIPADAVPCPVAAFGHGFQIPNDKYYSYGEHLASHGFILVLPTISNPFLSPNHNYRARLIITAARYAADLNFSSGDVFEGKVDVDNWAFIGHSMGGAISLLAGDRYVNYPDSMYHLADTLRCIISYASPQSDPATVDEHITTPSMILTGKNDGTAPWEDVYDAYWDNKPAPGVFAVISGANHCQYGDEHWVCDWVDSDADITREEQMRIARRHTTAFLYYYQLEDTSDCVYRYAYGDSILHAEWMDSVEVRFIPLDVPNFEIPESFGQLEIHPNPGNSSFRIVLPSENVLQIEIFDNNGRFVESMPKNATETLPHAIWTPSADLPSGNYLIRAVSVEGSISGKIIYVR